VVLFIIANKLTTAANAIFLQDTAPLYVLLLSPLLLRERPRAGSWPPCPCSCLGLSLFFLDQLAPGQLLGQCDCPGLGRRLRPCILGLRAVGEEGSSVLVWGNLIAGFSVLLPALAAPRPTALDVGLLVFLGRVSSSAWPTRSSSAGLRETPAVEASLLILLEPVLSPCGRSSSRASGPAPGPHGRRHHPPGHGLATLRGSGGGAASSGEAAA
jgi:drug/metabolite transporter (DMT)-like permease